MSEFVEVIQAVREAAGKLARAMQMDNSAYLAEQGDVDHQPLVQAFARHRLDTRPPASGVAEEPTEAMIEAGMDVLEKADEDMSVENYIAGVTPDWDYGMEAEAVWRAMFAAAIASGDRP